MSKPDPQLIEVLEEAQRQGLLGPTPVDEHVGHAQGFIRAIPDGARFFVDLGSGGGVPGLVIARACPHLGGALLDGSAKRAAFLRSAIDALDLSGRIDVWAERAEVVGRDASRRGTADVVVARSFGPPAALAECAAPLLAVAGHLIVSDPPSQGPVESRWPPEGLATLGIEVIEHLSGPPAMTVFRQARPCPARYPRRVGIPAKRPLF